LPLDRVGETLVALEREKWKRWNKDHFTWVENVLADEHLSVDATGGGVVERRAALKYLRLSKTVVAESRLSEFRILRPTSDTAVVTYKAIAKALVRGREHPSTAYCTSVWVNRDGRWQTVFYQSTAATEG